jgi:hypothetical protein
MRLYVANVTRQEWLFNYRLDFDDTGRQRTMHKSQPIPAGRQVQIGGDFDSIGQIDEIVKQLQPYGMIGVADIPRMDKRAVVQLVFNVGAPVPTEAMRKVRGGNELIYIDTGRKRREASAVAANNAIQTSVSNLFAEHGVDAAPADTTDVVIEQLEQSEAGERRIEEGYHAKLGDAGGRPEKPSARKRSRKH